MARTGWPHWMVQRVISRVWAGYGYLNPAHLAAEMGIEPEDVLSLVHDAALITSTYPTLYSSVGAH